MGKRSRPEDCAASGDCSLESALTHCNWPTFFVSFPSCFYAAMNTTKDHTIQFLVSLHIWHRSAGDGEPQSGGSGASSQCSCGMSWCPRPLAYHQIRNPNGGLPKYPSSRPLLAEAPPAKHFPPSRPCPQTSRGDQLDPPTPIYHELDGCLNKLEGARGDASMRRAACVEGSRSNRPTRLPTVVESDVGRLVVQSWGSLESAGLKGQWFYD